MGLFFNQTENHFNFNSGEILKSIILNAQKSRQHFDSLKSQHLASNNATASSNQELDEINKFKCKIEKCYIVNYAYLMELQRQHINSFEKILLESENKNDYFYNKVKQEHERLKAEETNDEALLKEAREFLNWLNEWEQEVQSNQESK